MDELELVFPTKEYKEKILKKNLMEKQFMDVVD